ncbi:MAG TPA: TIGR03761 family integrating conjugative element protein [Crenotrichaceae bacterium]|nr:TIGR03761 family integrating conjugative element protein [Crenotrichaceae bacterium]
MATQTLLCSLTLLLHTYQAQQMIRGRSANPALNQPRISGLLDFARNCTRLWTAASANDPYADWALIQIEAKLATIECEFKTHLTRLAQPLNDQNTVINPAQSTTPYQHTWVFKTPYANLAAGLLTRYDALLCSVLTARQLGLIDHGEQHRLMSAYSRSLRQLFALPNFWQPTGIQRNQIDLQSDTVQNAIQRYGDCPADILAGTYRPRLAPPIRTRASDVISDPVKRQGIENQSKQHQPRHDASVVTRRVFQIV